ncbi:MAG: hypothetical protein ABGX43_03150 [Nitrospinaceae bacterium]
MTRKTKMAALNRSGFLAARVSSSLFKSARASFSLGSALQAEQPSKLTATMPKKVSLEDLERSQSEIERARKMKGLITVEGAVDVGTTSVFYTQQSQSIMV